MINLSGPVNEPCHLGSVRVQALAGIDSRHSYKEALSYSLTAQLPIFSKNNSERVFFSIVFQSRNSILDSLHVTN